jgi:tetratricopeptide (TPR) repeat protein
LGRFEEAIVAYDDLVARFKDAADPDIREHVAKALYNKGVALGELGRPEAAIVVYDDLVARFKDATEPGIREQVSSAENERGRLL